MSPQPAANAGGSEERVTRVGLGWFARSVCRWHSADSCSRDVAKYDLTQATP